MTPKIYFMKPIFKLKENLMLLLLCITLSSVIFSCNNEDLFIDEAIGVIDEELIVQEDEDTESQEDAANMPCDFTLGTLQANTTMSINCLLDLSGETINLPANVTIEYAGGDIINGTLLFSEGSIISGELLNSSLNIEGTLPQLKDPVFNFITSRWDIVEGVVSNDVALNNRNIFQDIIYQTKLMNADVFNVDALDVYFRVELDYHGRSTREEDSAINIPSDFHLKMSDNTFLRVQPNSLPWYTLMKLPVSNNVTISGGHLVGDRFEHDYAPFTDEFGINRDHHTFGQLMYIIGSENIVVDNVHFSDPTGDAIAFHGEGLRNNDGTVKPGYSETNNVIIKNSTILRARRNGISFLDGRNIIIDNCIISDTGQGKQVYDASGNKIASSAGSAPMYGIDLEAIRSRSADGSLQRTALNEDIIIKNSTFTGNAAGDIVVFTANDVIIEQNNFDYAVRSFASDNITIRGNIFKSREPQSLEAISIRSFVHFDNEEDAQGEELNHHWQVYDNTIKEYAKGVIIAGQSHDVKNNIIENCIYGVFLIDNLTDSTFSNNNIISTIEGSSGYQNIVDVENINNLSIINETISVQKNPVSLYRLNFNSTLSSSQITFKNCNFTSAITEGLIATRQSKNITYDSNNSNVDFWIREDCENIQLINNTVNN